MNTQHLETEPEAEAQTYAHGPIPVSSTVTEGVTAPQLPTDAEVQQVFEQMKAKRRGSRFRSGVRNLVTSQKLTTPDPDSMMALPLDEVLNLLREESRKRNKRKNLFIGIFVGIIVLFVLIAIFTHKTGMFNTLGSYVSLITLGAAASQNQKDAALALTRFEDVQAVGPLAEALEFQDKEVARMAAQSLICLLPRMKASDAPLLSPEQRFCLNRALRGKNTELTLAILKAWEQVGDTKAIEEVEKLTRWHGKGVRNPKIIEAAQECLPFLRQSAERQQVGSQLLRAADGTPTASESLLRPAAPYASTEPPNELLRSGDDK